MDFGQVVYQLGKRYRQALETYPEFEFPSFSGLVADLTAGDEWLDLQGEYVVDFSDTQGNHHFIRVYFDEGTFEAQGTPSTPGLFNISAGAD